MGGVQVPVWITVALGVLAVVGTIGGAWGGQFIAGRNDSKKWQRERDREAQAFWRDKRLEVYAVVLAEAQDVSAALWGAAGFGVRSRWTDDPPQPRSSCPGAAPDRDHRFGRDRRSGARGRQPVEQGELGRKARDTNVKADAEGLLGERLA